MGRGLNNAFNFLGMFFRHWPLFFQVEAWAVVHTYSTNSWFLHVLSSLYLAFWRFCNKGSFIKDVRSWRGDDSPKADIIKEAWI